MKKLLMAAGLGLWVFGGQAAEIKIFYSPTCPHCHHAIDFVDDFLVKEDKDLKVTKIDASKPENKDKFIEIIKKCELSSGGVPVVVIGEKCFQGFGRNSGNMYREALGLPIVSQEDSAPTPEVKKNSSLITHSSSLLYVLMGALLIGLWLTLFRKQKTNH